MIKEEFENKLIEHGFMEEVWKPVLEYTVAPITADDTITKLLLIYFTYITDGSSCMPLKESDLLKDWKQKCSDRKILLISALEDNVEKENAIIKDIDAIEKEGEAVIPSVKMLEANTEIVGKDKLFYIERDFLYTREYYRAKEGIKLSIERLFTGYTDELAVNSGKLNVNKIWSGGSEKQKESLDKGFTKNIIITGGPGTGKTTSVFYLLMTLLKIHGDYKVYLTAPSGKAASHIKESILEEFDKFNNPDYDEEKKKLSQAQEYTIHRLLGMDYSVTGFKYDKNKRFDEKSIFIIDEASMIDISLFNSLLEAIPQGARVFILGDKHQLPSVECGAVLADLLNYTPLNGYIVELDESYRFTPNSEIHKTASKVNVGKKPDSINWQDFKNFTLLGATSRNYPVEYYHYPVDRDDFVQKMEYWGEQFYSTSQKDCSNVPFNEASLNSIIKKIDDARVLSAQNGGRFGVNTINQIIRNKVIDHTVPSKIRGYYPGIPVMITENNRSLELYNGDTGVIVQIETSDVLYFLIKKTTENHKVDATKLEDKILKVGEYMLYPLRMLDLKKLTYAYSITIHKSQGSGYNNIMVILPNRKGHPLLNRQIIYTAITRTKRNTYIISDDERLEEAVKRNLERYTGIVL